MEGIFCWESLNRLGWERRAIALARVHTRLIKKAGVICRTLETYGALSHLFLIQSFSKLLITLFIIALIKQILQSNYSV